MSASILKKRKKEELFRNLSEKFIVECRKMREIYAKAAQISPYNVPVMITGESGTGKDKLADYIHQSSFRSGRFVHINCSAIPEQLFESKMFGYEAGSFTGALNNGHEGFIEQAEAGTLFLDEIGDMPLELQSKLLTFLEHRKYMKVGGKKVLNADVRIIAATNKKLHKLIKKDLFREDLYYRLSTVEIEIPALKERKKEIPHFIDYFCNMFNERYNKNIHFDDEAVEMLRNHDWNGNIRELKHVVEKLVLLSVSETISTDFIRSECRAVFSCTLDEEKPLKDMLDEYEKKLIEAALQSSRTLADTAKSLGIDLSTLTRKRQKYKI